MRTTAEKRRNYVLKDMILSGELSEGQRLPSERDLALRLGVARELGPGSDT